MVSKEKFLDFISIVKKNEQAVLKMESSLEGYSVRELSIFSLLNYAPEIAADLLNIQEEQKDCFYEDFWNMIDNDRLEFEILVNNRTRKIIFNNWEDFYNYYTKEAQQVINCLERCSKNNCSSACPYHGSFSNCFESLMKDGLKFVC